VVDMGTVFIFPLDPCDVIDGVLEGRHGHGDVVCLLFLKKAPSSMACSVIMNILYSVRYDNAMSGV
jgi:hypothetical protein